MPTELIEKPKPVTGRPGGPGRGGRSDGNGARSGGGPTPTNAATMGLGFALAAIAMLFVAFTTTYLGHRQDGTWAALPLPGVLWVDTAVLLASSAALEWGRRQARQGHAAAFRRGITAAWGLGLVFLAGQLVAWRQLAHLGIYLSSNPHSSFFYLLTGAHGVHLLVGLAALGMILPRAWEDALPPFRSTAVEVTALYWHFLTVLWLYLFVILFWL
ncbi:MAG TPA: cytochrome c oxidase subunit 3 [bacterium]|nr:cytochrome c oxidase subunit 3 [bacterium]